MHLDPHPLATRYPLMGEEEYAAFKDDIRANGVRNPVWLYEGKILDGRNRYRACVELGIEPPTAVYAGDDPGGFADSQNLHRRHLTAEWRRERVKELRAAGMSTRKIAKEVGVSHQTVANDLKAGVKNFTPEPEPTPAAPPAATPEPPPAAPAPAARVTGADGKTYPATRPDRAKAKADADLPTREPGLWPDIAKHMQSFVELLNRAETPNPTTGVKPCLEIIRSLERTGRAMIERAHQIRRELKM